MAQEEITIFTEIINNRILYILDFIFVDFLGIKYKVNTNFEGFKSDLSLKINLSNHFYENEINFKLDNILLENEVNKNINYQLLSEFGICFYWLSRYEEYIAKPEQFDQHQRFLGSKLDYTQPIVDYTCIEIQRLIKDKYPEIEFKPRIFKQINTHDVDFAWKYLNHTSIRIYGSILKKIFFGKWKKIVEQVGVLNKKRADPYDMFFYLETLAKKHKVETIFFWLLGDYSSLDKNHHWKNEKQKQLILKILEWAEIGIHPSYQSNENKSLLTKEINRLEIITNRNIKISRQHFIKLQFPYTYEQLLINGVEKDFTMGFPHKIGFRAGTCTPFKWFNLSTNKQTSLTIYPFVAMDITLKNYLKLNPSEAIEQLGNIKDTIRSVGGFYITLFHQSNLNENWTEWKKVYESIFD